MRLLLPRLWLRREPDDERRVCDRDASLPVDDVLAVLLRGWRLRG